MLVCTSMESKKTVLNGFKSKILIITYYWPPSGGSGVQRWMYFAKYLKKLGYLPFVITVDESRATENIPNTVDMAFQGSEFQFQYPFVNMKYHFDKAMLLFN